MTSRSPASSRLIDRLFVRLVFSSGIVMSASGSKVAWIDGKWDSKLDIKYGPHDPAHLLWQTNPWPADCEKYYGVCRFFLLWLQPSLGSF